MKLPDKLSAKANAGYRKLFSQLRKRKRSADDILIEQIHDAVFEEINCLECANCCKTHSPLFIQGDVDRIAKHLRKKPSEFMAEYLMIDEDGDWIFHTTPCPFLSSDNKCSIYSVRPKACREYPHTNRKKIYQIEDITLKNAEICPAVTQILDRIQIEIKTK